MVLNALENIDNELIEELKVNELPGQERQPRDFRSLKQELRQAINEMDDSNMQDLDTARDDV